MRAGLIIVQSSAEDGGAKPRERGERWADPQGLYVEFTLASRFFLFFIGHIFNSLAKLE
jgi:hypothetical protein